LLAGVVGELLEFVDELELLLCVAVVAHHPG
jgi:hypothetical protein